MTAWALALNSVGNAATGGERLYARKVRASRCPRVETPRTLCLLPGDNYLGSCR